MSYNKPEIVFADKEYRVVEHPDRGLKYNTTVGYLVEKSKGKDAMGEIIWEEMDVCKNSIFDRKEEDENRKMVFILCRQINQLNGQLKRFEKRATELESVAQRQSNDSL